ncbi:MAG: hypothetical protein CL674_05530 [Bdellovibrionaceae bacterium]|nr:hypothetical protein [Pseudobdellovibrionaceae bacterium]|tara:strand:- start:74792 stop:75238 length:447 start_codon:yes stop_codon:yes gene_type:complete
MSNAKKSKVSEFGVTHALEALAGLDPEHRDNLLKQIAATDPDVAEELERRMFQFEDLAFASSLSLSNFLKEISDQKLCLALRGMSEDYQSKIFSVFSSRKKKMLKDEMQMMGPQALSKVKEARAEIMGKAKAWLDDGKLVLENSEQMV